MNNFKSMKFFVGDNLELSKKIQEELFSLGYIWNTGSILERDCGCALFTDDCGIIRKANDIDVYNQSSKEAYQLKEIVAVSIEPVPVKPPDVIFIGGKKYLLDEVLDTIKPLKPI